ncbi:MAG: G5 domain-containing protein [Candidatus Saccharimonadales bacterium]
MWGWFTGLSLLKKSLLVGGSVLTVGTAAGVAQPPEPTPPPPETPPQVQQEKIETKDVTKEQTIPFQKLTENDSSLEKGKTAISTAGVEGVLTITYRITYTNGIETSREKISEEVTKQPINEVTRIGTKVVPQVQPQTSCTPGYSPCIAPGSDVDCAGGSGDGPRYVSGPVSVTGSDPYGLDRDGDGIGCE